MLFPSSLPPPPSSLVFPLLPFFPILLLLPFLPLRAYQKNWGSILTKFILNNQCILGLTYRTQGLLTGVWVFPEKKISVESLYPAGDGVFIAIDEPIHTSSPWPIYSCLSPEQCAIWVELYAMGGMEWLDTQMRVLWLSPHPSMRECQHSTSLAGLGYVNRNRGIPKDGGCLVQRTVLYNRSVSPWLKRRDLSSLPTLWNIDVLLSYRRRHNTKTWLQE